MSLDAWFMYWWREGSNYRLGFVHDIMCEQDWKLATYHCDERSKLRFFCIVVTLSFHIYPLTVSSRWIFEGEKGYVISATLPIEICMKNECKSHEIQTIVYLCYQIRNAWFSRQHPETWSRLGRAPGSDRSGDEAAPLAVHRRQLRECVFCDWVL